MSRSLFLDARITSFLFPVEFISLRIAQVHPSIQSEVDLPSFAVEGQLYRVG